VAARTLIEEDARVDAVHINEQVKMFSFEVIESKEVVGRRVQLVQELLIPLAMQVSSS